MYESKDKSKDEPNPAKLKSGEKEDGPRVNEGTVCHVRKRTNNVVDVG